MAPGQSASPDARVGPSDVIVVPNVQLDVTVGSPMTMSARHSTVSSAGQDIVGGSLAIANV